MLREIYEPRPDQSDYSIPSSYALKLIMKAFQDLAKATCKDQRQNLSCTTLLAQSITYFFKPFTCPLVHPTMFTIRIEEPCTQSHVLEVVCNHSS